MNSYIIENFDDLPADQQETLLDWIDKNFMSIKSFNTERSSYGLKHIFERSENGFYITNDAFKGAMVKSGYRVKDTSELNWNFNISKKSPCLLRKNV